MTEPGPITLHKMGDELHTCPACGYALGFHTSFTRASTGKDNPIKSTREVYRIILICPECGARYDVGWRISLTEFESKFVKTPAVSAVAVKPVQKPPSSPDTPPVPRLPAPSGDDTRLSGE